jgi:hypothetical protein
VVLSIIHMLCYSLQHVKLKFKLYYDRRSFGQTVLVFDILLGPALDQILIAVKIVSGLLKWATSLARGRICSLQLLLGFFSPVFFGSESCRTHGHILWEDMILKQLNRVRALIHHTPLKTHLLLCFIRTHHRFSCNFLLAV